MPSKAELWNQVVTCHSLRPYALEQLVPNWGMVDYLLDAVAGSLLRAGIRPDCVGSLLANCPEQLLGWLGTSKAGAIWAPLNASLAGDDLAHTLRNSGARLLITDAEGAAKLAQLPAELRDAVELCLTQRFAE